MYITDEIVSHSINYHKQHKIEMSLVQCNWIIVYYALHSDRQQTSALSCATVLDVDFVKCPHNRVMAAL